MVLHIFGGEVPGGNATTLWDSPVWGAAGVSEDTVLARFYTFTRAMQIADGPNEVHLRTMARIELKQQGKKDE